MLNIYLSQTEQVSTFHLKQVKSGQPELCKHHKSWSSPRGFLIRKHTSICTVGSPAMSYSCMSVNLKNIGGYAYFGVPIW